MTNKQKHDFWDKKAKAANNKWATLLNNGVDRSDSRIEKYQMEENIYENEANFYAQEMED